MKAAGGFIFFSIFIFGCSTFQMAGLYDQPAPADNQPNVNGFYQVAIFHDAFNGDVWVSKEPACVQVASERKEIKSGEGGLDISWNKQAANCEWIGMGFGWDNWTGKDLSYVSNSAAVSFWAKSKKGSSKGLPWAIGFEDFAGSQAWTGVTADCVTGGSIGESWTQVVVPLERFNLDDSEIDASTIKQMLFQFESSGSIWLDEISIVPYVNRGPKEIILNVVNTPEIDGVLSENEWPDSSFVLECGIVKVSFDANNIYVAGSIKDETPLVNNEQGKNIWNGDAVEIAFSTNSTADAKRKILYSTDEHFGIQLGGAFEFFDWQQDKQIEGAKVKTNLADGFLIFEASVPWSALDANALTKGKVYGIEVAIDQSGKDEKRFAQLRWNSPGRDGFYTNPSLWGKMKIDL